MRSGRWAAPWVLTAPSSHEQIHTVHPDTGPDSQALSPFPSVPPHLSPQVLSPTFHPHSPILSTLSPASTLASQAPISTLPVIPHRSPQLTVDLPCSQSPCGSPEHLGQTPHSFNLALH